MKKVNKPMFYRIPILVIDVNFSVLRFIVGAMLVGFSNFGQYG